MKRWSVAIAAVLAAAVPAVGQEFAKARLEKSPRHQEYVKVEHDNRVVNCLVVYPEVKDKAPAVIVIHEIFGLADWPKLVADELAEAGYIAIAPDLLSGMGPNGGATESFGGRDAVTRAVRDLPPDQVTQDLDAVAAYVAKLPACNGKVAVCGFCWGGGQAFRYATNNPEIQAAFVFYGTGPEDPAAIQRIKAPVYGFYGGNDNRVNATIPSSTKLMEQARKRYDPVVYEGAGHGFMRSGEPDNPDARPGDVKAREEAWARWKEILSKL
jgi:carboxymethylenebutenolidase